MVIFELKVTAGNRDINTLVLPPGLEDFFNLGFELVLEMLNFGLSLFTVDEALKPHCFIDLELYRKGGRVNHILEKLLNIFSYFDGHVKVHEVKGCNTDDGEPDQDIECVNVNLLVCRLSVALKLNEDP